MDLIANPTAASLSPAMKRREHASRRKNIVVKLVSRGM